MTKGFPGFDILLTTLAAITRLYISSAIKTILFASQMCFQQ